MTALIIGAIIFLVVAGIVIRYMGPSPREVDQRDRQRRITNERLYATLLAAEDNPMYVIPPQAIELARQLTDSKELNP